jgi:hypothetical protein
MPLSKVMTIRVEPDLLEQLRVAAENDRRSVSGEVLHLVRQQLGAPERRLARPKPTMGWFSHLDVPEQVDDFRAVRAGLSGKLGRRATRRKGAK